MISRRSVAPFVEFLAPDDDRLEGQRAFAKPGNHGLAAGLDALGDGDFAFARQKLHRAHLAQVHAHRIVGAVGRLFLLCRGNGRARRGGEFAAFAVAVGIVLGFLVFAGLVFLDHIDAHVGEHRQDVLDLFGGHLLRGQHGIELVHGHITPFLRGLDHFLDGVIRQVEQRPVRRSALALVVCVVCCFFYLGCHGQSLSPDFIRLISSAPAVRRAAAPMGRQHVRIIRIVVAYACLIPY
jgi:hypothetical protein